MKSRKKNKSTKEINPIRKCIGKKWSKEQRTKGKTMSKGGTHEKDKTRSENKTRNPMKSEKRNQMKIPRPK